MRWGLSSSGVPNIANRILFFLDSKREVIASSYRQDRPLHSRSKVGLVASRWWRLEK
jgi:hypothetical protein